MRRVRRHARALLLIRDKYIKINILTIFLLISLVLLLPKPALADSPPVILWISDEPDPVNESNSISIRANVIDDVAVGSVWVNIGGINYSLYEPDFYLTSAIHNEANRTEVFVKDETFFWANLDNAYQNDNRKFYLNFTDSLVNGSVLRMYAKKDTGVTAGIYARTDTSGLNFFGNFTITQQLAIGIILR